MTLTQTGKLRHGVRGYPVTVQFVPGAGESPISLVGATAVQLKLHLTNAAPSKRVGVTRSLSLSAITDPGPATPTIRWIVMDGDIPTAGQYLMEFEIDFADPGVHFAAQGILTVE